MLSRSCTACCAAALVLLPESPRWLVVQGKLDEALAVMHRILTNARLPQGEFPRVADHTSAVMMPASAS